MTTVQTIVRGISTTSGINFQINKHFNKLKRAYCKIKKCRVSIELAKNNTHKDKLYCVCISITIPGKQLISKK
ncbi:hypothetical protein BN59_00663 [Legionella massiliensis]|uniref:Uncharacterized protein n=1 Tax=Legionella massiliensis TaxID=1034943 RepID=A0A078KX94_9GAMM|nr:hypothetical protein [Legionella massiliensis]CDZ76394.1 hypothetical protein BN59_00663 [Legionella massiliensis]CEE12132.1 hypothetical protein BN1094_00663 [Legionella massiliensis]